MTVHTYTILLDHEQSQCLGMAQFLMNFVTEFHNVLQCDAKLTLYPNTQLSIASLMQNIHKERDL